MTRKPPVLGDFDLWSEVARTVKPLGKTRRRIAASDPPKITTRKPPAAPAPAIARPSRPARSSPPQLTGLDRQSERRMSRGKVEIDARIDLHGMGLEVARLRLHDFLARQRGEGARLVLVITGKGASPFARHTLHGVTHFHTPERDGRLRREIPEMFHEAAFRSLIAGFQPAHPRHGGGGAFYVKLRRPGRGGS